MSHPLKFPTIKAQPTPFPFDPKKTALLVVDFQRDFLEPGGWGQALGGHIAQVRRAIKPAQQVLNAARSAGIIIIYLREGYTDQDLIMLRRIVERQPKGKRIGDPSPLGGRYLVNGHPGHQIISEMTNRPGELVIDKPGKNAFLVTGIAHILADLEIENLLQLSITTDVCGLTTFTGAADFGLNSLFVKDASATYSAIRYAAVIRLLEAQNGIFGYLAESYDVIAALEKLYK